MIGSPGGRGELEVVNAYPGDTNTMTVMDSDSKNGWDEPTRGSRSLVRPFGYVENRPIIRRIGARNLYLGNKFAAVPDHHDRTFEFVLSLTEQRYPLTTHHRPLIDGTGNEWNVFAETVDTARSLYRQDGSVLIHCTAGISRSSTVLATMLAVVEGIDLRDALTVVQDARPHAVPNPALHELAVIYLAAEPFE